MAKPNKTPRVPTGGVLPSGKGGVHSIRVSRQIINDRRRKINAALRANAQEVNARRRAAAKADFMKNAQAPDYRDDENYGRTVAIANAQLQNAITGVESQRRELGINYGLGEMGGSVVSNPYSRAALLQKSYDQNQRRTQNAMAAAGQLYSGSTQNARNFNTGNYSQGRDSLQKDFDARLGQTTLQEQQANDRFFSTKEAAEAKARQDAQKTKAATIFDSPYYKKPEKFKPNYKPLIKPIKKPKTRDPQRGGGVRP